MDPNDVDDEMHCCKICRAGEAPNKKFCSPCKCAGSIKYVHESCLQEWLKASGSQDRPRCEVCATEYRFQRVHELRIVSLAEIWQMLQTCMADAYKAPAFRFACIFCMLFVYSFNHCFSIYWWYDGRKPAEDLQMDRPRDFAIPLFVNICEVLCVIPAAVIYKWTITESNKQRSKEHVVTEAYYSACALALHREQAMFGLEDLLSLQHRHRLLSAPLSPIAQEQYEEQMRDRYTHAANAAAMAGDQQLIKAVTDCVGDLLPNVTIPRVVNTAALQLQQNLLSIPLPNPWWLVALRLEVGNIEVRIQTAKELCDAAPSLLYFAWVLYTLVGYWVVPGNTYFTGRAAWCVESFLSSPDRVRWVLWVLYGSSATLGDADTLALLHKVFTSIVAWYVTMAARYAAGWMIVSILIDIVHALHYISLLTKPKHGMKVITVIAVLRDHVFPALVTALGRMLLFWCTYLIYPTILSHIVWHMLQGPPLTASMCLILYCGCLWFVFQADRLVCAVQRVLQSCWENLTPGVLFVPHGSVLHLCVDVVQSCIVVVLLFASCVVLPLHFGHLLCPGATLITLSASFSADVSSTSQPNSSDALLLLVHGFCMPVLLFHVPLQAAVCWLVEQFVQCTALQIGLGHILASNTPATAFGPPTRAAAAADATLPPQSMDMAGLIAHAPRWSCAGFYTAVEIRVGIWSLLRAIGRPLPKPSNLLLPAVPHTLYGWLLVVSQAALLVVLFLAGTFVLSSWLLHVPLLVGNCVHTALFGAAGMPLPTVGVFQYCTGAVCCVLAANVVNGICREVRRDSNSDSTVLNVVCVAGRWLQRAGAVLAVGLLWATFPTCMVGYLLVGAYAGVFTSSGSTINTVWTCGFWGVLCMLLLDRLVALGIFGNVELFTAAQDVWRRGLAEFQAECCLRSVVLPVCLMLLDCAVLPYFVARCAGMWFVDSYHMRARLVQCCHLVYIALCMAGWAAGLVYGAYWRVYDALFLCAKLKNYDTM